MKVAVSAVEGSLDAQVDPRFGRSPYFVIVDVETMEFEALPNEGRFAASGAGIQAAQTIANKGVGAVLTGRVGPNACQAFSTAGIQVMAGVSGAVRDAIEKYKNRGLQQADTLASQVSYEGRPGMGMGRGGGRGRSRSMGYKRWQTSESQVAPANIPSLSVPTQTPSREEEIQILERQIQAIQQQLDQTMTRLKELKGLGS